MKICQILMLICVLVGSAGAQIDSITIPESNIMHLPVLLEEAIRNNLEIQTTQHEWDMQIASIPQAGSLDDPTIEYMQDEFPGLDFADAMSNKIRFMQMIPFPGKLSAMETIAQIQSEHSHHEHLEKINDVLTQLKSMYVELWFIQQSQVLMQENIRLMNQFSEIALAKYRAGSATQQDVLKAEVEIAKMKNGIVELRAQELGVKAMMQSLLNRPTSDTLGSAVIREEFGFPFSSDTLVALAIENRQMLLHDSMGIEENETMLKLSQKEFLPDFTFSIEHIYSPGVATAHTPAEPFNGWSVAVGINIPFAPWVLGKANSRVESAELGVKKARAQYEATRTMISAKVRELHAKIQGLEKQILSYAASIIPTAQQSLNVSVSLYQNGKTDFLMMIDSFRSLTDLRMEYFMLRMQYEQAIAQIEQTTGIALITEQD